MSTSPDSDRPAYPGPPPVQAQPVRTQSVSTARAWSKFLVLIVLVLVLASPYLIEQIQFAITRGHQRALAQSARELLADLPEEANRYRLVAQSIEPSVVGIEVVRVVDPSTVSDEWSHLFRRYPLLQTAGEGSGVIVDESGYVLTNFHVIGQATEVTVRLSDGRTVRDVEVVGADPLTDLAVLKINTSGLTAAPWGDSGTVEVGDPVLAVGNPFGLARTVTAGIISAKGRRGVVRDLNYQDFLQTDAAVNPGNSGGPLVNMKGQIVGINTAIIGEAYRGISFAIPSHLARDVYERLKETGKVARGWLGVAMQELDESLAERLGLESTRGALVAGVVPDSPAEAGGLEPGDVVVKWNDEDIRDPSDLSLAVAGTEIGSKAVAVIVRGGKKIKLSVEVGERPARLPQ